MEHMVSMVDLDPQTTEDRLEAREELRRVPLLDEEQYLCRHDHNSYRSRVDACHAKEECRPLRMDDIRYVGCKFGYHDTQAFGVQRTAPSHVEEKEPW